MRGSPMIPHHPPMDYDVIYHEKINTNEHHKDRVGFQQGETEESVELG